MHSCSRLVRNVGVVAILFGPAAAFAQLQFRGLGFPPGGLDTLALGVSADGTVVVGRGIRSDGTNEAFRWSVGTGMVGLGVLPPPFDSTSWAAGVSGNGSVVVGYCENRRKPVEPRLAFRWTQETGMVGLGPPPLTGSVAHAASSDGSVIVGEVDTRPFRWTAAAGPVRIYDGGGARLIFNMPPRHGKSHFSSM